MHYKYEIKAAVISCNRGNCFLKLLVVDVLWMDLQRLVTVGFNLFTLEQIQAQTFVQVTAVDDGDQRRLKYYLTLPLLPC